MIQDNRPTRLDFTKRISRGTRGSEIFRPDERNANAEALICLKCQLPECNKIKCKRFDEELRKIKEQDND